MEREGRLPEKINGSFFQKDILSLDQFDQESLSLLFDLSEAMRTIAVDAIPTGILAGNVATLLFYEPSSRTRGSFDAAIKQLGGQTVVVENPQQYSSVSKGETFEDTIQTFEAYSDIIVLRHSEVGKAKEAASVATRVPIFNAGDGIGEHPTQALLDLLTIKQHSGSLMEKVIVVGGDIKNGRTIHSLLKGLSLYKGNQIYTVSPPELSLTPEEILDYENRGLYIEPIYSMDEIPMEADFWYWTRVQKERFENPDDYARLNNKFVVTEENFNRLAGEHTGLMHPLPRVGEIEKSLDSDPRSLYLTSQIRNGMYVRMALSALVLGKLQ